MVKILIVFGVLMLVVFLSGCTTETSDSDDDTTNNAIVINIFQVTPALINYGETANLSWKVTGATAVEINQDIGSLPLEGSRIINPIEDTTYTLIASKDTTSVTATAYIMVVPAPPAQSAPNLAWTIDDSEDTMTITSGSTSHKYSESPTEGNLIFKVGATNHYLKADLSLGTTETGLSTNPILAGDVITGFESGITYQVVWVPTNKLLGTVTFTAQSAPNLAWTVDDAANTITMTSGSSADNYAAGAGDANLIFKTPGGTEMYVAAGMGLTSTEAALSTKAIAAGDVITGFTLNGNYQMIWEPTDKLLGSLTFST